MDETKKPEEKPKKKKPEQGMLFGEADVLVQTLARLIQSVSEDIEKKETAIDSAQSKLARLVDMKYELKRSIKIAVKHRDTFTPEIEKAVLKADAKKEAKKKSDESIKKPAGKKGEPQKAKP